MRDKDKQLIWEAYTESDSDQWDGGYEAGKIADHAAVDDSTREGASSSSL